MSCRICDMIQGKADCARIYEDDQVIAFMAERPATIGHIIVAPKQHLPIFEALNSDLVEHVSAIANKISIAVFEAIKCEGTNMIIQNGMEAGQEEPHFCVNVIARKGGDGLNFEWPPKQVQDTEMEMVEDVLRKELGKETVPTEVPQEEAGVEKGEDKPPEQKEKPAEEKKTEEKEENYMIKQLKRMP